MNPQSPELKKNTDQEEANTEIQKVNKNENYVQTYSKKSETLNYVQENINNPEVVTKNTLNDLENQINKNLPRMSSIIEGLENQLSDPNLSPELKDSIQKRIEGLKELKNKSQEVLTLIETQKKNQEKDIKNNEIRNTTETQVGTSNETNEEENLKIDYLEGYNQLINEIVKTKNELSGIVKNLSEENLDPQIKSNLETKAKELVERLKQLREQLEAQEENINEENLRRSNEIKNEISNLESQSDSEDKQRQLRELNTEYQNLIVETDQKLENYKGILNKTQTSSIDTSNQKLNIDLVTDINETLSKLDISLGEKFRRIENNNRVSSLS